MRHGLERRHLGHARVVHEIVDRVLRRHLGEGALGGFRVGEVDGVARAGKRAFGLRARQVDHLVAVAREPLGDAAADPARGAGDERDRWHASSPLEVRSRWCPVSTDPGNAGCARCADALLARNFPLTPPSPRWRGARGKKEHPRPRETGEREGRGGRRSTLAPVKRGRGRGEGEEGKHPRPRETGEREGRGGASRRANGCRAAGCICRGNRAAACHGRRRGSGSRGRRRSHGRRRRASSGCGIRSSRAYPG